MAADAGIHAGPGGKGVRLAAYRQEKGRRGSTQARSWELQGAPGADGSEAENAQAPQHIRQPRGSARCQGDSILTRGMRGALKGL